MSPTTDEITQAYTDDANKYGIPPDYAGAMFTQESNLNPNVSDSPTGAIGLGQLEPATAKALGVDPRDWRQNVDGSVRYLAQQMHDPDFNGNPALAFAAYNAGPGRVKQSMASGAPLPSETQNYVASIDRRLGGKVFNSMPSQATPMQMAQQQPQQQQDPSVLFGGNPTPVGLINKLSQALGYQNGDDLGRRLQNAAGYGIAVGLPESFGSARGAAMMNEAANQPHFDVVSDALGNRYILDKRTGAISMPTPNAPSVPGFNNKAGTQQAQQTQQQLFKPSGDPQLDAVVNSPLGAVESGKQSLDQTIKDKQDLEDAGASARQLYDLAARQLAIAQSGKIVQGPGVMNWVKEHGAEALGQSNPLGVDLDLQNQFDLNNQALSTLMGKSILNNARVAGPELRFLSMIHPNSEYTQGANVGALQDIMQRAQRMGAHAQIGRQYKALGPNYYKEIEAYDKANPLYSNHGNDTTGGGSGPPPASNFWLKQ